MRSAPVPTPSIDTPFLTTAAAAAHCRVTFEEQSAAATTGGAETAGENEVSDR